MTATVFVMAAVPKLTADPQAVAGFTAIGLGQPGMYHAARVRRWDGGHAHGRAAAGRRSSPGGGRSRTAQLIALVRDHTHR
ncbi:MAG: hypothetical protein ACRDSP_23405 [Pseudonocardiaceae bacterium]